MRILFAFENPLPSSEADAEVFVTTAKYLAPLVTQTWLHVPAEGAAGQQAASDLAQMPVVRAFAPLRPPVLRHICCGLTLPFRREFRQADLVYTRNLWVAWLTVLFGQNVVFDHYRPWPDQIPPLQYWLYRLFCHRRLLVNICHSNYTRAKYLALGIPAEKLRCVHNGFEPQRLQAPVSIDEAKRRIGVEPARKTVVYTGRVNRKKGLELVVEAAKRLPDILFLLVGSYGDGPIETLAAGIENIRIVPWQTADRVTDYIFAADILLIPPSWQPLAKFGSTVLPLKLFFYLASGRPILAGSTPDVCEVLRHGENAFLCPPDDVAALVSSIEILTSDSTLARRLIATALDESRDFTWTARAEKIVEIIAERLPLSAPPRGTWSRRQFRAWLGQSCRWGVHLIRKGSWILPPDPAAPGVSNAPSLIKRSV